MPLETSATSAKGRDRVNQRVSTEGILLGAGIALFATAVLPTLRAHRGDVFQAIGHTFRRATRIPRRLTATVREDLEDLLFDIQMERMKRSLDRELQVHPHGNAH
ncbi:hypothetical protein AYW79_06755 [Ferroacidibacillus organovorans]|uniref:Uncharacterized protein n=1 Tax=Ferroacidibacillus organovorans TaxID=1765683 RepID=A0A853KBK0_9BACL|nr:hypothetical protein AYJ22_05630 [Ferroacidibacillus organovorans]OAG94203.1 hypothetical protein AYW79_06755 [Ferroacidibacillus organovorans]